MSLILDEHERPAETKSARLLRQLKAVDWRAWCPLVVSIIAVTISVYSCSAGSAEAKAARDSAAIAREALEISKTTERIHVEPDLGIRMQPFASVHSDIPVALENFGIVPAIGVEIVSVIHTYDDNVKRYIGSSGGYEPIVIDDIAPREIRKTSIQPSQLNIEMLLKNKRKFNVLEIRVRYMRSFDLKRYQTVAFYFLGEDNKLISHKIAEHRDKSYTEAMTHLLNTDSTRSAEFATDSRKLIRDSFYDD
jgi:hypothetical protein